MADKTQKNMESTTPENKKIVEPVLFCRKTFSVTHGLHCTFRSKRANIDQYNVDNILPHLQEEAEKEKMTKETLESSYQAVEKQRSKKKRWLSFGFLMLNLVVLALILYFQIKKEGAVSFADLVASAMNWWWLIVGVLLFMVINILDSMRIAISIKKVTGRWRPFLSYKSTITCRFYDSITPLSTGGQPFQIYYLSKRGLNASTASSVPLSKYVYGQLVFVIYTGLMLLISIAMNMTINPVLLTMSWIGLILNALLIIMVFFLSISKKVAPKMIIGVLKLGAKLHIVKDYKASFRQLMRTVKEYTNTFKMFMKSGWNAFFQIILSILYLTAVYTIPFVVYCMFNNTATIEVWFRLLVLQVVCDLAISFIPLPGGAGSAELSFGALFSEYFKKGVTGITVWALLFWRIFTYYGYLLQGAILLFYDFLIGNKKIAPLLQKFKDEDKIKVEEFHQAVKMPAKNKNNKKAKTKEGGQ